eukprot:snap_masked-scaffold_13-processed-gene-2.21-mRNA-1 protein AED:1.00 eAED:1.00 QI:0/-1/0/0/-1/1/1/0/64
MSITPVLKSSEPPAYNKERRLNSEEKASNNYSLQIYSKDLDFVSLKVKVGITNMLLASERARLS